MAESAGPNAGPPDFVARMDVGSRWQCGRCGSVSPEYTHQLEGDEPGCDCRPRLLVRIERQDVAGGGEFVRATYRVDGDAIFTVGYQPGDAAVPEPSLPELPDGSGLAEGDDGAGDPPGDCGPCVWPYEIPESTVVVGFLVGRIHLCKQHRQRYLRWMRGHLAEAMARPEPRPVSEDRRDAE